MRTWPALELGRLETSPRSSADQPPLAELIHATLSNYNLAAIEEVSAESWRIFFHDDASRDRAATVLRRQFADLSIWAVDIADDNWAARSQAGLHAIQVDNIIVAPPWDIPAGSRDNYIAIVIQPSMGFGTGHHATTRLCLRAMQRLTMNGCRVIDVGTGSGVLAIAASRLGAEMVLAIDSDPDALRAAEENLALNGVSNVDLQPADLHDRRAYGPGDRDSRISPASFDVVLANLTGGLLSAAAGQLQALMAPPGRMILSGFTLDEEDPVRQALRDFVVEDRAAEEGWVCVTVKRGF